MIECLQSSIFIIHSKPSSFDNRHSIGADMNIDSKMIKIACFAVFLIIMATSSLPAYVLQGRHVLDLVIEKLGPAETLFVTEKLTVYRISDTADRQYPADERKPLTPEKTAATYAPAVQEYEADEKVSEIEALELEGTLRYVFGRAFRSDIRSPDSERIHINSAGRTLTIVDGSIVPGTASRFSLFKDVLLFRSREALAERLLQMGIDVSVSSLGRFEDRIAFILGANYPDEGVNQLWVDKETLRPLRLIINDISGSEPSGKVEIRYLIWWKIGETHYPSRLEFYQDDNLVRVSQAKNFEENAVFSEDLFNISRLETLYPRAPLDPAATAAAEEPSEVQQTIDDFKRIFE